MSRIEHLLKPRMWQTVVALILSAFLVVHYAIIGLYLTPTNPLKTRLWRPVHEYVGPFFTQNWQLFAPTPIASDELMTIKLRWYESASRRTWETDWIDISSPVHRAIHRTRIGPYSKLARPYTGLWDMANIQ